MSNSKTLAIKRRHRKKEHAARERLKQFLAGKLEAEQLPQAARRLLQRRLRVAKRG
jgi:hypothetical protein